MHQVSLLVFFISALVACASDHVYAQNAVPAILVKTNEAVSHRSLKGGDEITDNDIMDDENRAYLPEWAKLGLGKPRIRSVATIDESGAKLMSNPRAKQAMTTSEKQPGLFQSLKNSPIVSKIRAHLSRKANPFIQEKAKKIGALAIRSTPGLRPKIRLFWEKYGAYLLHALGAIVLSTLLYVVATN